MLPPASVRHSSARTIALSPSAALNFGDVFSYSLAAVRGEPLLFKGREFAATDVSQA